MPARIPVELLELKGQWVDATEADFTLPFLKDTINRQLERGHKQTLTLASELSLLPPRRAPTAFIFHMSRCGSTLVSRMLAAVQRFHVVSEPACLSDALSIESIGESLRDALVSGLINALAPAPDEAQAYFLKLTSWNIFQLLQFKRLYPHTPWIFVYRNPIDVLASHARGPAAWRRKQHLVRACNELGTHIDESVDVLERTAQILACICQRASQSYDPAQSLLLNYEELPAAVYERVASFLEFELSTQDVERMHAVSLQHSKTIDRPWRGDQQGISDLSEISVMAKKYLLPIYEQLQLKRR